ncbi:restriction endonuclease [Gallibacter sp. Marseille-QA0791]|uniref:restriction endonuclease n=1 Tax=Gallibacter sp. Marseille-QA0791 TaxID=3378781 RepID=UPI003D130AF8
MISYLFNEYGIFAFIAIFLLVALISTTLKYVRTSKELSRSEKSQAEIYQRLNFKIKEHESEIAKIKSENTNLIDENKSQRKLINNRNAELSKIFKMELKSLPYLAGIMSDYITYDIEILAKQLDWGENVARLNKVNSIREIRKNAKEKIEAYKIYEYQLLYLLQLFPELRDLLETDFKDVPPSVLNSEEKTSSESLKNYLSNEEWERLSPAEINQLALDRYVASTKKTKWQIGRDYELYIGYLYEQKGWEVTYFGSEMRISDLGRDLIATKDNKTEIVQCKYWSNKKQIHEKHIFQLYGTTVSYILEHTGNTTNVVPRFVTNITLSDMAKTVADYLNVNYVEHQAIGDFPRIKCNIGIDEYGKKSKIYHLPMDQQYDNVKINHDKGEFFALTVKEAEEAGFRRAYKWHNH